MKGTDVGITGETSGKGEGDAKEGMERSEEMGSKGVGSGMEGKTTLESGIGTGRTILGD